MKLFLCDVTGEEVAGTTLEKGVYLLDIPGLKLCLEHRLKDEILLQFYLRILRWLKSCILFP